MRLPKTPQVGDKMAFELTVLTPWAAAPASFCVKAVYKRYFVTDDDKAWNITDGSPWAKNPHHRSTRLVFWGPQHDKACYMDVAQGRLDKLKKSLPALSLERLQELVKALEGFT